MNIVIDANALFSLLIKHGKNTEIFFNLYFNIYTPEFLLQEFEKHKVELLSKTSRTEEEFEEIFEVAKQIIEFIPKEEIIQYFDEAERISPDPDDVMYFALALKLNCPIWSNDKKLKEQNKVKVYSTEDLIKEFNLQ